MELRLVADFRQGDDADRGEERFHSGKPHLLPPYLRPC
jgi:hypothetical protein